ncbi:MAG: Crp/Fnr family transcriptional regulator [Oscillospiraceae bacterium]|nr:Crp/Fnr family transcriptional regulator [Oscillospiraceae bacterium]
MMVLSSCPLFWNIPPEGITSCLQCSTGKIVTYQKGQILFHNGDTPRYLYVLLEGSVEICQDFSGGSRIIINVFQRPGQLFGEVFLFFQDHPYPCYSIASQNTTVLEIPKSFFYETCGKNCNYHTQLIQNMLSILAKKTYFLNRKVQLLSRPTLRQKIVSYLFQQEHSGQMVTLPLNREQLADYLGVTRPSLSRELMKMQRESLIAVKGRQVTLLQMDALRQLL